MLSKSVGIFYKLKQNIPTKVLVSLYYSLFYPYICYGNLIWGKTYHVHISRLKLTQKIILRINSRADYRAHTIPLFYENKILKFTEVGTFLCTCAAFTRYPNSTIQTVSHRYETRGSNQALH